MPKRQQKTLSNFFSASKPKQGEGKLKTKKVEEEKKEEPVKKRISKLIVKEIEDCDEDGHFVHPPSGQEIFKERYSTPIETIEKYSYSFCLLLREYWKKRNCKVVIKSKIEKMDLLNRISEACDLTPPTYIPGCSVMVVRNPKTSFKQDTIIVSLICTPERVQVISMSFGNLAFDRMKLFLCLGCMFSNVIGVDFLFQTPYDFNIRGIKRLNLTKGECSGLPMVKKEKGLIFQYSNDFNNIESQSTDRILSFFENLTGDLAVGNHVKWATDKIMSIADSIDDPIGVPNIIKKYINKINIRASFTKFIKMIKPKRLVIVYPGETPERSRALPPDEYVMVSEEEDVNM